MIPKQAHVVWNHAHVLQSNHELIQRGVANLIRLNPDWHVQLYTPKEVDDLLAEKLSPQAYALVKDRHFVSKIDLWRLLLMYDQGGLYMDIDRWVNIPLSEVIPPGVKWVLPTTREYDFSCDLLLSAPHNPAYQTAALMYLDRLASGWQDQYFLGPQTHMHAVSLTLMGEIVNTDPGLEKFTQMRQRISEMPFVHTFREEPFDHMLLYRGNQGHELEQIKRDFYAQEGVKHWTGDW